MKFSFAPGVVLSFIAAVGCGGDVFPETRPVETLVELDFLEPVDLTLAPPAFPGAIGFGATSRGGRGGRVLKVTHLRDSGEGSLRWAVEASGPRTVVFEVGGIIDLEDTLQVNEPFLTIAGQTAPGKGIVLRGARLRIAASDVIVRGMRFRPGDGSRGEMFSNRDCISVGDGSTKVERVIIDHNSCSWAMDENLSVWGEARDVTFSNNLAAEPLNRSRHPEGQHAMGFIVGGGAKRVTVARNLMLNSRYRCPLVKDTTQFEFLNNYCFNFFHFFEVGDNTEGHIVGNYFEYGENSRNREPLYLNESSSRFYVGDNRDNEFRESGGDPIEASLGHRTSEIVSSLLFAGSDTPLLDVTAVRNYVLENAGARWPVIDDVDARIFDDLRHGRSRVVDSPDQVGGYPDYPRGRAPSDHDNDGMPDSFEHTYGFNPLVDDSTGDLDHDGFSNLEEYINGLISGFDVGSAPGTGVDPSHGADGPQEQFRVEAEHLELDGFFVVDNATASEGAWIRVREGASGRASYTFGGVAGRYEIVIGYFDEEDGESEATLSINDSVAAAWRWNKRFGSRLANAMTQTEYSAGIVELSPSDRIAISGRADGLEPLRYDYLSFSAVEQRAPLPVDDIFLEAEDLSLDGMTTVSSGVASGNAWVQIPSGESTGAIDFVFEGVPGRYDLRIALFDENDGVSSSEIFVDGEWVAHLEWNEELGSRFATANTLIERTVSGLDLIEGSHVRIEGRSDGAEPHRIDYMVLTH